MAGELQTYEEIMRLEEWEAAFYAIRDSDDMYDLQQELEKDFEIDFDNMEDVKDLPQDTFSDFKKRVTLTVTNHLNSVKDQLYQKVCVEFEYCKKRDTFSAKTLEGLILLLDFFKTGGIAYFTFFGFKSGFFDQLCRCGK